MLSFFSFYPIKDMTNRNCKIKKMGFKRLSPWVNNLTQYYLKKATTKKLKKRESNMSNIEKFFTAIFGKLPAPFGKKGSCKYTGE